VRSNEKPNTCYDKNMHQSAPTGEKTHRSVDYLGYKENRDCWYAKRPSAG
jgi:hypothetical protein